MKHLEVSGAGRPLKWSLGVKWLSMEPLRILASKFHFSDLKIMLILD